VKVSRFNEPRCDVETARITLVVVDEDAPPDRDRVNPDLTRGPCRGSLHLNHDSEAAKPRPLFISQTSSPI
jgi:hypothetical protein